MARFIGGVKGAKGAVTRIGHSTTGLEAHAHGWNIGGDVTIRANDSDRDVVMFSVCGGSNGGSSETTFAVAKRNADGAIVVTFIDEKGASHERVIK